MNSIYVRIMQKYPAKILDIDIGTGTLSSHLYESVKEITGVDFSAEMLV